MIFEKSKRHLVDNDMTYWQHLKFASSYGIQLIIAGCSLIIHSFIPAFFSQAGRKITHKLNKVFTNNNKWLAKQKHMEIFQNIYRS